MKYLKILLIGLVMFIFTGYVEAKDYISLYDQTYLKGTNTDLRININFSTYDLNDIKVNGSSIVRTTNDVSGDYITPENGYELYFKSSYLESLQPDNYEVIFLTNYEEDYKFYLKIVDCNGTENKCGISACWSFNDSNKTLYIKGSDFVSNNGSNSLVETWNEMGVKKVVVEEGITGIDSYFFNELNASEFVFPDTLTSLGYMTLANCKNLESIVLPDSVSGYIQGLFLGDEKLKNVKLSDNISVIGQSTFQNCKSLVELDMPANLISIDTYVFSGCDKLRKIYFHSNAPSTTNYNSGNDFDTFYDSNMRDYYNTRIYVPTNATGFNKSFWKNYNIFKYDGVIRERDYHVVVNYGDGSFDYDAGDTVVLNPKPPHGKQFTRWVVNSGNVEFDDASNPNATFTMPAEDVEITAEFVNAYSSGEDNIAPAATSVRIVKDEIYKPGIGYIEVDVIEEDSGIRQISMSFYQENNQQNGIWASDYSSTYYSGTIRLPISIDSKTKNGEWMLTQLTITDAKNNQVNYNVCTKNNEYYLCRWTNSIEYLYKINKPSFIVKDEYNINLDASLSNPNLVNRINNLKDNEAARILMDNNNTVIKKEVFDAIKGTNKTIIVYRDAIEWVFRGSDIVNETKDVDAIIEINQVSGSQYGLTDEIVSLQFKSNGLLPGVANVRIKSDYLYRLKGITGNLYLYYDLGNELEETAEDLELILDGSDKWVSFPVEHNSKYYITGKKIKGKPSVKNATVTGISNKVYNGKAFKPTVTVRVDGKKLKLNKDYTVKYKNNKKVGVATVTIKGKGKYVGTYTKTFTIKPKATTLSKLKSGKEYIKVYWKKQTTQTSGYEIQYSTDKSFKENVGSVLVSKNKTTSTKIKELESTKKYYVRVRTYKSVSGVKYYSKWSKVKNIKVK